MFSILELNKHTLNLQTNPNVSVAHTKLKKGQCNAMQKNPEKQAKTKTNIEKLMKKKPKTKQLHLHDI